MRANTREVWSRPIQASIDVPMDIIKVEADDKIPGVHIRLEGDNVYVSVMAYDHVSYLKSRTVTYREFVNAIGEYFFQDWRVSK